MMKRVVYAAAKRLTVAGQDFFFPPHLVCIFFFASDLKMFEV